MFRRTKREDKPPIPPGKLAITLTIETDDSDAGRLTWSASEQSDRSIEALEAAATGLFARAMQAVTEE
jgi:hypothetical protein